MNIKLKNVGCINEATVDLTGLNVIAGENGSGKSTVGKTVYTIIKIIRDCNDIVLESKERTIHNICSSIYFSIQNNLRFPKNTTEIFSMRPKDVKLLHDNFNMPFENNLMYFLSNKEYQKAKELIIRKIDIIDSFFGLNDKSKLSVKKTLNDLKDMFNDVNEKELIKQSLMFMYEKMFKYQINNIHSHKTSEILFDNNNDIFEYQVSNNADKLQFSDRLKVIRFDENLKQSIFPKVTFVETALITQLVNNNDLPFHWIDIINKLKQQPNTIIESVVCKETYEELSKELGGELLYAEDIQSFYFRHKGLDNRLFVNNMASGEKMFGILQRMARLELLSPDHLLIFDEPENHLHPRWQVKLAEILTTLVENDVPVLLTTHSATLTDALQQWAESKDVLDKTKFYFAKKSEETNEITIENVDDNDSKDPIFESFYDANKFLPKLSSDDCEQ